MFLYIFLGNVVGEKDEPKRFSPSRSLGFETLPSCGNSAGGGREVQRRLALLSPVPGRDSLRGSRSPCVKEDHFLFQSGSLPPPSGRKNEAPSQKVFELGCWAIKWCRERLALTRCPCGYFHVPGLAVKSLARSGHLGMGASVPNICT